MLTGSADTFVIGSSMGGLISAYAIAEYPDIFRVVAVDTGRAGLLCRSRLGDGQYYDEVFHIIL